MQQQTHCHPEKWVHLYITTRLAFCNCLYVTNLRSLCFKISRKARVDALIQLKFRDYRGQHCVASKRMLAAYSRATDKTSTKTDEFTLQITDENGEARSVSAKVADFNKEVCAHFSHSNITTKVYFRWSSFLVCRQQFFSTSSSATKNTAHGTRTGEWIQSFKRFY